MHTDHTPAATAAATPTEQDRLRVVAATAVLMAQRLPRKSEARRALALVVQDLLDLADDLTPAPRITLDRAQHLANASVAAGLARWEPDPHGDLFRPGERLCRWLSAYGEVTLNGLREDEAEELDAFLAAA